MSISQDPIVDQTVQGAPLESPPQPLVDFSAVTKSFGQKTALENVSWTLPRGMISGLLGPNGAGKTTLFRLLMGILKPSSGTIRIGGLDSFEDRVEVKRLVGYLPDEPIFYSYLSGREILELSAAMHGLDATAAVARLMPLVERLGLSDALPR